MTKFEFESEHRVIGSESNSEAFKKARRPDTRRTAARIRDHGVAELRMRECSETGVARLTCGSALGAFEVHRTALHFLVRKAAQMTHMYPAAGVWICV